MTEPTVMVGVTGDSGPYAYYYAMPEGTPASPAPRGSYGFGSAVFPVPAALWEEYARVAARKDELEAEFGTLEAQASAAARAAARAESPA